jgi:hypothetical protein
MSNEINHNPANEFPIDQMVQDTEGHRRRGEDADDGEDTEGHRRRGEDADGEDTEGHRRRGEDAEDAARTPRGIVVGVRTPRAEDTEGHRRRGEDAEGRGHRGASSSG